MNTKNDIIIEDAIQSALKASVWGSDINTLNAFVDGARFIFDFLQVNPGLVKDATAEDLRNIIYPSIINNT